MENPEQNEKILDENGDEVSPITAEIILEGRAVGKTEAKFEIATNLMFMTEMSVEAIAQITELPVDQLIEWKTSLLKTFTRDKDKQRTLGRILGETEVKIEIAFELMRLNQFSPREISKATDLPLADLEKMKVELDAIKDTEETSEVSSQHRTDDISPGC